MYVVMITGGLGSGKSELTRLMCTYGASSLDTDKVAHELLTNDEQVKAELVEHFGVGVLDDDGAVVAARLARVAFADEKSTEVLNAIMHPRITQRVAHCLLDAGCTPVNRAKVIVVEVPLLDKVPEFARLADETIAVVAPAGVRVARAVERGMNPEDALERIKRQTSDEVRAQLCTIVCDNSGTREELAAWVKRWWAAFDATSMCPSGAQNAD